MKKLRTLVPYHTEEEKKRLEDYIFKKTGKRIDLGPIHYGGKLTLQTLDADLSHIDSTNITCAPYFPGPHFRNVDEFIDWHRRISDMHYLEAYNQATDEKDVVALSYDKKADKTSYVCFRMGDRKSIERCLSASKWKARSFKNKYREYWVLLSTDNGNMLMFDKLKIKGRSFSHISSSNFDYDLFRNLISMNQEGKGILKEEKNEKWSAERSVEMIDRMLLENGWAPTIPRKKTGTGIIISTVKKDHKKEHNHDNSW